MPFSFITKYISRADQHDDIAANQNEIYIQMLKIDIEMDLNLELRLRHLNKKFHI